MSQLLRLFLTLPLLWHYDCPGRHGLRTHKISRKPPIILWMSFYDASILTL